MEITSEVGLICNFKYLKTLHAIFSMVLLDVTNKEKCLTYYSKKKPLWKLNTVYLQKKSSYISYQHLLIDIFYLNEV